MPSGPGDLCGLKDFRAYLTAAGVAISWANHLCGPTWATSSLWCPWGVAPPHFPELLKPEKRASIGQAKVSYSDPEYASLGSFSAPKVASGFRESSFYSLATSVPFLMSVQKSVQLSCLALRIASQHLFLITTNEVHSYFVLSVLARLNPFLDSLQSSSGYPFYQCVSSTLRTLVGRQLLPYESLMAISRVFKSLIVLGTSGSTLFSSVEYRSQSVLHSISNSIFEWS